MTELTHQQRDKNVNSAELFANIDKIHTTDLGVLRIKRNLNLTDVNVVEWCIDQIHKSNAMIDRRGKNWYIMINSCEITVNAYSYTIITAHRVKAIQNC